jgi:phage baseplate assembly protein V
MLEEIIREVNDIRETLKQIVRVGTVKSIYPERGTVRVEFADIDGVITDELPLVFAKTLLDKYYFIPDIGEQVICVFLPYGIERGFVVGAIYSKKDTVPVKSQDKWHVVFNDGTFLEYDRKNHVLTGNVKGDAELYTTGNVLIDSQKNVNVKAVKNVLVDAGIQVTVNAAQNVEIIAGAECKITSTGETTITAPVINLVGQLAGKRGEGGGGAVIDNDSFETKGGPVILASQGTIHKLVVETFLALYDNHDHPGDSGGTTGKPNQKALTGYRTVNVDAS